MDYPTAQITIKRISGRSPRLAVQLLFDSVDFAFHVFFNQNVTGNFLNGVHDGGVISSAEHLANLRQGSVGLATQ